MCYLFLGRPHLPSTYGKFQRIMKLCYRNDWSSDSRNGPPSEREQHYDGPPGMDVDGIIQSNWDEVSTLFGLSDTI